MNKLQITIIFAITIIFCSLNINAATWTVTKSTNSNDGVCDADCSLREAVAVSNSGDRIIFNSNLVGQTFTLGGSFLSIPAGKTIEIDGNLDGTNVVFLSGNDTSFHFFINEAATVSLKNIALTQGRGGQSGSIFCSSCNLSLDRVSIRSSRGGNYAAIGFVQTNGNVVNTQIITNSSITNNTTTGGVGAVISVNSQSTLYMSNTTVSGNRIEDDNGFSYGGIYISRNAFIRNCTIADNTTTGRGGGIVLANGTLDIGNTIVAKNTADLEGQDMYLLNNNSQVISRGGNLIGDTDTIPAGIFIQTNDAVNLNPLLAPSNSNQGGHPVFTYPLQAGSPAINKGVNSVAVEPFSNTALTNDERGAGFPRIAGNTVDKGAFEDQSNGRTLVVSKLANSNDNVCDTDCSLREAVYAASIDPGTDNITFAANVFGTMTLGGSEISIENQNVNIIGYPSLSSGTLIVSGSNTNRVFRLNNANVTMTGFTIANGNGAGQSQPFGGGGLVAFGGSLTLNQMIVRNNSVSNSDFIRGGGIAAEQVNVVRIMNSTINTNSAPQTSAVQLGNAVAYITNTTIANNTAGFTDGFGTVSSNGALYMRNSTVANNRNAASTSGSGLYCGASAVCNTGNSIFAGNTAANGNDLFVQTGGTLQSLGGNLVQNNTGFNNAAMSQQNDVIGVDPMLMSLADNGGNVPTMMLSPTSLAINGGVNSSATDPFSAAALTTDARGGGYLRILNGVVDKGAIEVFAPTAAPVSISGRVTDGKRGIMRASVEMTDQYGITRTASTDSRGYFQFENVESGEIYIFNISAKDYTFPAQVLNVTEQVEGLNFVMQSGWGNNSMMRESN